MLVSCGWTLCARADLAMEGDVEGATSDALKEGREAGVTAPVESLPALVDADARLVHRGRWLTVTFLLEVGEDSYLVDVVEGRIASVRTGPFVMPSWRFALRAAAPDWSAFWSASPPAGSHDLFALLKRRALRLEGDLQPFMANLQWFKDTLALLRDTAP
jgi:hypothetical protein